MKLVNSCVLREGFFIFETVSKTRPGHNTGGIPSKLFPEPCYADVHRTVGDNDAIGPSHVQQLLAGKHPSGILCQDLKDFIFGFCERNGLVVKGERLLGMIEFKASETDNVCSV